MPVRRRPWTRPGDATAPAWNSCTKLDQGKGGTKVLKRNQSDGVVGRRARRLEADEHPNQLRKTRSDPHRVSAPAEHCRALVVCRDNKIAKALSNAADTKPRNVGNCDGNEKGEEKEEEEEEEGDEEAEMYDVKEMDLAVEVEQVDQVPQEIPTNASKEPPVTVEHPSLDHHLVKPPPTPTPVAEEACQSTLMTESKVEKWDFAEEDSYVCKSEIQNKMQILVDLVMWKDISKSALMFGFGSFILISSSFTKDLNFSFVSTISYMGLIYLAVAFIRRSILPRGSTEFEELYEKNMVGEREAIWLVRMVLPYLNEILFTLKTLFSGDPATTVKLAIILYILARSGSSITIWAMTKLAFFGAFTIPKICQAYSTQLAAYGKFWVRRTLDAWDSCTHKKAAAAAIFTVIWNLSSVVARIWAIFILIVLIKFYRQSSLPDDGGKEEETVKTDHYTGVRQEVPNAHIIKDSKVSKIEGRLVNHA